MCEAAREAEFVFDDESQCDGPLEIFEIDRGVPKERDASIEGNGPELIASERRRRLPSRAVRIAATSTHCDLGAQSNTVGSAVTDRQVESNDPASFLSGIRTDDVTQRNRRV